MEGKKNKFSNLSEALKERKSVHSGEISTHDHSNLKPITNKKKPRAIGKRSNPDFEQVGAYIPKEIHKEVKKLLLDEDDLDFSDLVGTLLKKWLSNKKK